MRDGQWTQSPSRRRLQTAVGAGTLAAVAGCQADAADDTTPITLADQPFGPGDRITLERLGGFDDGAPGGSAGLGMHAVFSGSAALLARSERDRVADAIDVGPDHDTSPTYYGSVATDIPEDFLVSDNDGSRTSVTVDIPGAATHLFVAAKDNLFGDNAGNDYHLGLTAV